MGLWVGYSPWAGGVQGLFRFGGRYSVVLSTVKGCPHPPDVARHSVPHLGPVAEVGWEGALFWVCPTWAGPGCPSQGMAVCCWRGVAWADPLLCAGENPLEFLREQPQFQNMRQVIQQNPALLPALLQQLGQENPQLLQVLLETPPAPSRTFPSPGPAPSHPACPLQQISQHQEQFIQMLNEPLGELGDLEGEMGAIGDESPQMNYIQVTPQEKEAIERVSEPPYGGDGGEAAGLQSPIECRVNAEMRIVSFITKSHHSYCYVPAVIKFEAGFRVPSYACYAWSRSAVEP